MELGLTDNNVVIAGSSRGIGLAIARSFLTEGARVVITGRDHNTLQEAQASLAEEFSGDKIIAYAGDLSAPPDIEAALSGCQETFGGIDAVVANIGSGKGTTGWQLSPSDWQEMTQTNLFGAMALATAAVPYLQRSNCGSLTFISSIAGCQALPAPIPYSAAKAALQMAAKNLARELAPSGIRINTVAPGNVLFPGSTWDSKIQQDKAAVEKYIDAEVPLGRFATPGEIADAVVFLCSDRATFITGSVLVVDGGQTR